MANLAAHAHQTDETPSNARHGSRRTRQEHCSGGTAGHSCETLRAQCPGQKVQLGICRVTGICMLRISRTNTTTINVTMATLRAWQ